MNLYDFDNTIYDGESTIDFFFFCFNKKRSLARYLPWAGKTVILYELGFLNAEEVFDIASRIIKIFINSFGDIDKVVKEFWDINKYKLKPGFRSRLGENDIITTASPSFLIDGIRDMLNTPHVICSDFDLETGKFLNVNFRANKVISLEKKYPNVKIIDFYTDSFNDISLMDIAKNTFMVRGTKIYKLLSSKRMKYVSSYSSNI